MRALYFPHDPTAKEIEIIGDKLHHLLNVVRVGDGEDILLLDGKGIKTHTRICSISKKGIKVSVESYEVVLQGHNIHLAIGIPKKDALELSLKQATELGVKIIYLIRSDFSQNRIPELERLESVLVSALEQANTPFLPNVVSVSWEDIPWGEYAECVLMDSQGKREKYASESKGQDHKLLIIGPEGGFSPNELTFFETHKNIRKLQLPTPILRTPTAVATGVGFLLGTLLD